MNPEECTALSHTQLRNCSGHLGHPSIQNNAYALSLSDWSTTEKALLSAISGRNLHPRVMVDQAGKPLPPKET